MVVVAVVILVRYSKSTAPSGGVENLCVRCGDFVNRTELDRAEYMSSLVIKYLAGEVGPIRYYYSVFGMLLLW